MKGAERMSVCVHNVVIRMEQGIPQQDDYLLSAHTPQHSPHNSVLTK